MASYNPFSLAAQAELSGPRYAQRKSWDRFFSKKAKKATDRAAKEADRIAAELKEKPKGAVPGWLKLGMSLIHPGFGALLETIDTVKSQKFYDKKIKEMGEDYIVPGEYRNTFMENYLKGTGESAKQEGVQFLKGAKQTDLLTGLFSIGLQGTQALKGLGKVTPTISPTQAGKAMSGPGAIAPLGGPEMINTITNPVTGSLSQMPVPTTSAIKPNWFQKTATELSGKFQNLPIPGISGIPGFGNMNIGGLTNPILSGIQNPYMNRLLTPGTYAPIGQDWLMNYLTRQQGEPYITELSPPKFRF